jgi:hypothetical protein
MTYHIRPATSADIAAFSDCALPRTIRALVVVHGGKPVAISGVTLIDGPVEVFSHILPDANPPPLAIWRCAVQIIRWVRSLNLPAFAIASPDKPRSGAFLQRLGFTHVADFDNKLIYGLT